MGRRKKPQTKPWLCWYCTRDFDDERVLILHQRARHFKCASCQKKLYTGPGLAFHCLQVHKEIIYTVPNALENKNYITFEIYGMNGIPSEEEVEAADKQLKNVRAAVTSSGTMQPISNPLFPSAAQATIPHFPVNRLLERDLTCSDHGSYQPAAAAAGGPGPREEFSPRSPPMLDEWQLPKRYRERISEESEYINPPGRAQERMWQSGWSGRSARVPGRQVEPEDNFDRSQGLTEYVLHNMPTDPDPSEEQAWQNMPDRTHPAEDWIRQDTSDRTRLAEEQIGQNMYGKRRRLEEHWMRPDTSGRTHMAGDWVEPDTSGRTHMREDWVRPDTSGRTPRREDWIRPDTSSRTHMREWIRPNTSDRTYMREDWISPDTSDSTHRDDWISPDTSDSTHMREDWISPDTSDSTHMREDWIRRDISRRTHTGEDWIRPGTSDGTRMEEGWIRPNTSDRQTSLPEEWVRQNPSDRVISRAKRWNRQNIADRIHLADEQVRQSMIEGTNLAHGMHLTEQVWQNISEKIRLAKEQIKQDMSDRINHEEQVWSDRTAKAEEQVGYNTYGRRTGLAEQGWRTMSDRIDHAEWQDLPGGRDFLAEQSWQENSSGRTHLLQERVWEAIWSSINEGLVGEEAQQMGRSGKIHLAQQIWQEVWYSMEGLAEEEAWQDTSEMSRIAEEHFLQHRLGQQTFQAGAQGRQNNRFNRKPYFSGGQNRPMKNASLR